MKVDSIGRIDSCLNYLVVAECVDTLKIPNTRELIKGLK